MARTPGQRGPIGNWLVESRLARGWETQERARAEVQRLTGWRVPQSMYAEWESGRRIPSDANLTRLQEFYGTGPGQTKTAAPDDPVAAAIRDLTAQMARIETRLESVTGALDGWADGLALLLAQLVSKHVENADEHEPQHAGTR